MELKKTTLGTNPLTQTIQFFCDAVDKHLSQLAEKGGRERLMKIAINIKETNGRLEIMTPTSLAYPYITDTSLSAQGMPCKLHAEKDRLPTITLAALHSFTVKPTLR